MRIEGNSESAALRPVEDDIPSPSTPNGPQAGKQDKPAASPPAANPPSAAAHPQHVQHLLRRLGDETARLTASPERGPNARPSADPAAPPSTSPQQTDETVVAGEEAPQHSRAKRGQPNAGPADPEPSDRGDPAHPQPLPAPGIATLPAGPMTLQYQGQSIQLQASLTPAPASAMQRALYADRDSLYRPASASFRMTAHDLMEDGTVGTYAANRRLPERYFGTTMAIMATAAATPRDSSNLFDAARNMQAIHDGGGTNSARVQASIASFEDNGMWNGDARDLPYYLRHPGATGLQSGDALARDLEQHFSTPYNSYRGAMGHPETFALIGFSSRGTPPPTSDNWKPPSVMSVQRMHTNGDYRNDTYTLYNPIEGAFRYDNFNQMAYAVNNYFSTAYPVMHGFSSASTSYYAMQNVVQHPLAAQRLGAVGGSYGIPPFPAPNAPASGAGPAAPVPIPSPPLASPPLTPPRADLPPPPDFDRPGPSGYQAPRHDLKRSADAEGERQPMALYRPSNVTPADLKKHGGFSAEETQLGKVNLDTHNFDVAADPGVIDGAGYLGTFRQLDTAQKNRALAGAANGYVYAVAPTPNMVDVNATLGARTRNPDTGEVAAMGRIDYTQIRGWQKIENGKPGKFIANPDYRWDVYDQTRTAGAQPQLSRFAVDDPAWGDSARRPFATAQKQEQTQTQAQKQGDKTAYAPRQDPDLTQASFYSHALEKISDLNERQARGEDHRGPVELISHNGAYGILQANVHTPTGQVFSLHGQKNTDVTITNYEADVDGLHKFRMGDDGRFHTRVLGEDEVLRVGGDGYLYLDYAPRNPQSTNGVFRYENNRLIHQEDGKVLTYSHEGYAYVSSTSYDSSYSQWKLTDGTGTSYAPPRSIHSYRDSSAGTARTQYEFDKDPDSALPVGVLHFATQSPQAPAPYPDTGSFIRNASRDHQQQIADWLNRTNTALLFKDGFYVVATGEHTLEVRNLQGNTIKTVQTDAAMQDQSAGFKSDYSVSDRTWARLQSEQLRRERFEAMSKTTNASR